MYLLLENGLIDDLFKTCFDVEKPVLAINDKTYRWQILNMDEKQAYIYATVLCCIASEF